MLGKNDREAGFESPYACWPQGTGYEKGRDDKWGFPQLGHNNCNPNRAEVAKWMHKAGCHSGWAVPRKGEAIGTFEVAAVSDPEWNGKVLEARLVRTGPAPSEVVRENGRIWLGGREEFNSDDFDEIGIWVRGNGGFGKLSLGLSPPGVGHNLDFGYRSYICHDG